MRAICQTICYLVSLFFLLFFGSFFDTAFRQAGFHAKHLLPGVPLPRITEFFIGHHHLPGYLVLFPWLAFVGGPLLSSPATCLDRDASTFFLRFVTYLMVEAFVFLLFVFALAAPFVPYYGVMEDFHESTVEFTCRLTFWGMLCLLVVGAIFRLTRRHAPRT